MAIRTIDIAHKFGVSTTTIRTYEERGLVPPVSRTQTGYRIYTDEHIAYFSCVRRMLPGFTLSQIAQLFGKVMQKDIDSTFWMINKIQSDLHQEKTISKKMIENLIEKVAISKIETSRLLTINEISKETGVPTTTIRFWDKSGLITASRNKDNNYRIFNVEHIRQILLIYAIKSSIHAKEHRASISRVKEELTLFDYTDKSKIKTLVLEFQLYLNQVNRAKLQGIVALYDLCVQVETDHYKKLL